MMNYIYLTAFALAISICSGSALSINKCSDDDKITYTDLACPAEAKSSRFIRQVIPPDDPAAAKRRSLSNQRQLNKIQQQKQKEEKRYEREHQVQARQIKRYEDHQFKCNELGLKKRLARRQLAEIRLRGNSYQTEKARLKVKQAENRYVHNCRS